MSRFAPSPLINDRSAKKPRLSQASDMATVPEDIADVVPDGDAIVVLSGFSADADRAIGLRVSSHSLSQASPLFKTLCSAAGQSQSTDSGSGTNENVITLLDDDGPAMNILVHILHLRNDKLPARVTVHTLSKLATLATKYQCVVAAGRATVQWFDHLYASNANFNVWSVVEAAYLLDEPIFFARFSSRWVLQQSMFGRQVPAASSSETQKLGFFLAESQIQAQTALRNDLDNLAYKALVAFSKGQQHHINYAPEMSPEPEGSDDRQTPGLCHVDSEAAKVYLGALGDAEIFPSARWEETSTIGDIVAKVGAFVAPDYDDSDKCDFCDEVKVNFTGRLAALKKEHEKRLWGMCLDCYKAGGSNAEECRYEHAKVGVQANVAAGRAGGLGIDGL